jgi:hypothetical protein
MLCQHMTCPTDMINISLLNKNVFYNLQKSVKRIMFHKKSSLVHEIEKHPHYAWHASKSPWLTRSMFEKHSNLFWDQVELEKQTWYLINK